MCRREARAGAALLLWLGAFQVGGEPLTGAQQFLLVDDVIAIEHGTYSGWRRNETLYLSWDEVDVAGGVIRAVFGR